MTDVVVLGAGLVGKDIAKDLASTFRVTAVDRREEALKRTFAGAPVEVLAADLSDPAATRDLVAPFDLVVGALPGHMGYRSLEAVIEAGKNVVDIAFFPEDPFRLDELARNRGVTAIVDFGVAPGMSNAILGHHVRTMASVQRFECVVGGLPVERTWPFDYKAPFSPADVLEEYTRPARYIENGAEIVRPALSDPERMYFEGIGTLEALNTDGLRTLVRTHDVPNMKEKTLRYPGHGRLMEALREAGFLAWEEVELNGHRVRPRDFTSALLFPKWALREGEEEFTVMRVTVEGTNEDGGTEKIVWNLLDRYDAATGVSSMSRTTGYACAAAVHLLAEDRFVRPGICPPEFVGADETCFEFVLAYQAERGVHYHKASIT